ncbi:MAG: iron-sulfur cluster assembly accessory protein [Planctomycetaceae bacterium]|jgi:iron-sulfur cluster assembly protein|nr:iron-sulfur cluster assembly accessory protein [Planctomycetaceae bacterium]
MSITMTLAASEAVKKTMEAQNLGDETFLRIGILGGGCSGMQYALNFDTVFDEINDTKYEWNGVKLATLKKYDPHFDGTEIDFIDTVSGRGFSIENPNFPKTTGCACCGH